MLELLAALDADSCDACEGVAGAGGVVSTRGIASRLCAACLGELPERPEPLLRLPEGATRGWRGAPYAGPLGALVRASKYGGRASLADAVAAHAGGLAARVVREVDVVVAVPSPRVRVWWRGVDLAGGVAHAVGHAVGVPVARALVRRRWRAQAGLAHDAREANARGAFETRTGAEISGARVLLVDDVLTTGATAGACADALLQAGARRVDVFVAAAA